VLFAAHGFSSPFVLGRLPSRAFIFSSISFFSLPCCGSLPSVLCPISLKSGSPFWGSFPGPFFPTGGIALGWVDFHRHQRKTLIRSVLPTQAPSLPPMTQFAIIIRFSPLMPRPHSECNRWTIFLFLPPVPSRCVGHPLNHPFVIAMSCSSGVPATVRFREIFSFHTLEGFTAPPASLSLSRTPCLILLGSPRERGPTPAVPF